MIRKALFLIALVIGSSVLAQPSQDRSPLRPEEIKSLSLDTMLVKGEGFVKEMQEYVKDILAMSAKARDQKDFERMNCINAIMNTIKGLLRVSEQNALSLRERVIAKDRSGAEHEFIKIAIARNRIMELHAEAKGCGGPGSELIFEGTPIVEKQFDPDLPTDNARTGLDRPIIVIEPPPSASPYY